MVHPDDIENPYRCRTCNDAGTIDVWIDADVKALRADPNTPKTKLHHPTIRACNRCKRGRLHGEKGIPFFDGRIHCQVTSHDMDADHSSEGEVQRLAAFACTAQDWTPVESYEDVTGRNDDA
jgi:hypothetical protein